MKPCLNSCLPLIHAVASPVVNVTLSVTPRTIDVNWSIPLDPNGVLLTYIVSLTGEFTLNSVTDEFYETVFIQFNISDIGMANFTELEPYSNYTIGVSSVNFAGDSNFTEVFVQTPEAG